MELKRDILYHTANHEHHDKKKFLSIIHQKRA